MISIIARYLLRQYLQRTAWIAAALTFLLLAFDLLGTIVTVTENTASPAKSVLLYAALRLPAIVALVIPVSAMLGAIATMMRLSGSQEMTALSAAGITLYRLAGVLLLGTTLAMAGQFLLSNFAIPRTAPRLEAWAADNYRGLPPAMAAANMPLWLQSGSDFVRIGSAAPDGRTLQDLTLVRRVDGLLTAVTTAARADYADGSWHLQNVTIRDLPSGQTRDQPALQADLLLRPRDLAVVSGSAMEMSLATLWQVSHLQDVMAEPPYVYSLWMQRKFTEPLESLIMVLLAVAFGLQIERRRPVLQAVLSVIGLGFSFFIAERILLSLGEVGTLPVSLAVWGPAALFGLGGAWVMLNRQG